MLIVTIIACWILGIFIFVKRKSKADVWLSVSVFLAGLALLILFNSTLMSFYCHNFPKYYLNIRLIHSILSSIPQYLSPPIFSFFVLEFSGLLSKKVAIYKRILIYVILAFPWLMMFLIFPSNNYSYYFAYSKTFWIVCATLAIIYFAIYTIILLLAFYKADNPREKKQKFLGCAFYIPFSLSITIVSYININAFQSRYGELFWFFSVFVFLALYILFSMKYGFTGIKIKFESYDYSITKISQGTEILIHSLNREFSRIKTSSLNITEYCSPCDEALDDIAALNSSINHISNMLTKVNAALEKFELDKKQNSLSSLIKVAANGIENMTKGSNIEIEININDNANILCDKLLIDEVIKNILLNAIEAISNKGKIVICSYISNGFACIDIIDNGSGIPQDILSKVFDFYFTTKNYKKNNYGLGLYFCKKVMLLHKGDISIKSKEGYGTTIYLTFPIYKFNKKLC